MTSQSSDSWNTVTVSQGGNAIWVGGTTTVSGVSLKDIYGNDSYTLSVSKTGNTGVWKYEPTASIPSLSCFPVSESMANTVIGGNNKTQLTFTLSGFQSGDIIHHLAIGGFVGNTKQVNNPNVYTLTISGAKLADSSRKTLLGTNEGYTTTWADDGSGTVTLMITLADASLTSSDYSFATVLSGLELTGDALSITMGATSGALDGATSGLSYIGMFPEPTTGCLSVFALGLLTLRRRRSQEVNS